MPVETQADRAVFVDADDFGTAVSWTVGATAHGLSGIFDDPFASLATGELEFSQSGSQPQVTIRDEDVPSGGGHGDAVTVAGGDFKVLEIQPDGSGMTVIRLEATG